MGLAREWKGPFSLEWHEKGLSNLKLSRKRLHQDAVGLCEAVEWALVHPGTVGGKSTPPLWMPKAPPVGKLVHTHVFIQYVRTQYVPSGKYIRNPFLNGPGQKGLMTKQEERPGR